jgi:hypothetical protein
MNYFSLNVQKLTSKVWHVIMEYSVYIDAGID